MTAEPARGLSSIEPYVDARHGMERQRFLLAHSVPVLLVQAPTEPADASGYNTVPVKLAGPVPPALGFWVAPIRKRTKDAFPTFIWVGREPQCDVRLPFDGLSKLHAQFVRKPAGGYDLLDAGSTNGTFVDDQRLAPSKPVALADGARIRFGRIEARFRTPEGLWDELGTYPVRSVR